MKRFLLLILAITAFNTAIYADVKTIKYKQDGYTYMVIKGNFEKQTLIDGDVSIGVYYGIRIKGKYEKGELIGEIYYNGFIVEVQGTISNNENGGISTKCKPYEWKCDLRTKVVPAFNDSNCTVSATSSLIIETSPITINIPENEKSYREFTDDLENALLHIQQEMYSKAEKNGLYSATITFSDGLTYEGFVEMPSRGAIGIPRMSENDSYDNPTRHAKLTWPNGDTFEGEVYNAEHDYGNFHSNQIRPKRGTIRYHDGQVFKYSNSDFDNFKIGDNGLCVSPSEMKESFENTIREREEERLRKIREDEERKAAELRAKQRAQQEEEAKKIARKNELIRKYGQRYGEAIYKGEPKMGMTIEMIQDMHQQRGHMTRHISKGNEITVLSYGGGYVSFFGISGISASYRYTFVNGRLTEFTSTDAKASIDWL